MLDIVRRLGADEQMRLLHIATALLPEDEVLSEASKKVAIIHLVKDDDKNYL